MIFNSIQYLIFLPIVFSLYWFLCKGNRQQNFLLLVSSYFFYSCWDWRFLFLLIFSTSLDYVTGLKIFDATNEKTKKAWFWASITINLGFLGIFKYYNFFIDSFSNLLQNFGLHVNLFTLQIVLPVGISFYTFHGLSYVIDIYKKRILPEKNIITYSLFVSYFPLLVAGPIERATHLLPQLKKDRTFTYDNASNGLRQILWGLFKKVVIADNCAVVANSIFENYESQSGSTLLIGATFFAFQIYGDFSGYSDIALGTSKLFGIDLLKNFNFPYFSRDIAEFWRRWHISLSSWFKDYLYVPIGGSKGSKLFQIRNVLIIFLVSGFWHGANWTFVVWGLLNAIYFIPLLLLNKNRNNTDIIAKGSLLPGFKDMFGMFLTFFLTVIAWIFFRSETITDALFYLKRMFSASLFSIPAKRPTDLIILLLIFIIIEWIFREREYGFDLNTKKTPRVLRWFFYYVILITIYLFGAFQSDIEFIYFQF